MATLTVRNVDEQVKARLRVRAARNGRSLEEEVRRILTKASHEPEAAPDNIADAIAALFDPLGGIELDIPPRTFNREPPRFDE